MMASLASERGARYVACCSDLLVRLSICSLGSYRALTVIILLCAITMAKAHTAPDAVDLTDLSLEALLNIEVTTASKFPQPITEAPAAVTVITAKDIEQFGYRTLAEILNSIRGLYISYDRNYHYLGVRGFNRAGDYNSRVLLLINGQRINDNVYGSAPIGNEFPLDVDLIERVEFVPGPGSAIYGANAFFGVINVISKKSTHFKGLEAAAELASYETKKGRLTYAHQFENDIGVVFSASVSDSNGQNLYFPEFDSPANNNGIAENLDYDRSEQLFATVNYHGFEMQAGYHQRTKGIPTASFGQEFNTEPSETLDQTMFLGLKYSTKVINNLLLQATLDYGRYDYDGDYTYNYPPLTINRDVTTGEWWKTELRLTSTQLNHHKISAGVEYHDDMRIDQANFDLIPFVSYLDDQREMHSYGIYVEDEYSISEKLILNAGLRYDDFSSDEDITNPRLALIYKHSPSTTYKFLYGEAYRTPNAYELYYGLALGYELNPDLKSENITTQEIVIDHFFNNDLKFTGSIYRYKTDNLIDLNVNPVTSNLRFDNSGTASAIGAEIEINQLFNNGSLLRASYSWQDAKNDATGQQLSNSPTNLAKLNYSTNMSEDMTIGFDMNYTGSRKSRSGNTIGGYTLSNLIFVMKHVDHGLALTTGIYNLFDKTFSDPVSDEFIQDSIMQNGRNFRVKLLYSF